VGASRNGCFYQRDAGNRHRHTGWGAAQYRGDVEAHANGAAIASVNIFTSTIRYCDNFNSLVKARLFECISQTTQRLPQVISNGSRNSSAPTAGVRQRY
jgi:hypothetical protein